ncbi:MAG: B12-binding domain-containing radical SAM protein [Terriglobales bacterium]
MKVCLISPPTVTTVENRWMLEMEATQPLLEGLALGVLTLASGLLAEGVEVDVVDSDLLAFDFIRCGEFDRGTSFAQYVAAHLAESKADVFGFGTICSGYPATIRMAEELKKLCPKTPIVLGGPQASVVDVPTLAKFDFIDYVLCGEADSSMIEFVRCVASESDMNAVPGLTHRRHGGIHRNVVVLPLLNMDLVRLPAYHLHPYTERLRSIPLEIGRGCPFGCSFCSTNDFFRRKFRLKSPQRVMEEMDWIAERYHPEFFDFVHDMFTVDRKRVVAFCEAFIASGRNYKWGCSARTDCLDPELIDLMAEAGCAAIFFGIESGSSKIQKVIGKRLDLEEAARHVRLCADRGMTTTVSCIIGFPEEEDSDLRSTIQFVGESLRSRKSLPQVHILCPLPETPLHKRFRGKLALEEIGSELSQLGWSQDKAERNLIEDNPDVFPNFYSIPTPFLDRDRLYEIREFYLKCLHRFRWLLVAWSTRTGDLLSIFDEWREWRSGSITFQDGFDMRRYYATWKFDGDFVDFLFQQPPHLMTHAEKALLDFEVALRDQIRTCGEPPPQQPRATTLTSDMYLGLERYVYVFSLNYDIPAIIKLLENGQDANRAIDSKGYFATRLTSEHSVEVLKLPALAAKFMQICNPPKQLSKILQEFADHCPADLGITCNEAAELTLSYLYSEGWLRVYPSRSLTVAMEEPLRSFA